MNYFTNIATAAVLLFAVAEGAEPVRISFLREKPALEDTIIVMRSRGVSVEATERFRKIVDNYNKTDFEFDYAKFPKTTNGFYLFETADQMTEAFPHRLCLSEHAYDFNCLDTVITVAADGLSAKLRPDEAGELILMPHKQSMDTISLTLVATAREAFELYYPPWYRQQTQGSFPPSMGDSRISLTACLFQYHLMPTSSAETKLQTEVFDELRAGWKRAGIKFPSRFQIVLFHEVSFTAHNFAASHAGLLFPRKGGVTFIEKAGARGPFVRFDFADRTELLTFLAADFRGENMNDTHYFLTFNDAEIVPLRFTK